MILGSSLRYYSPLLNKRTLFLSLVSLSLARSYTSMTSFTTERITQPDGTTTIMLTPQPESRQSALVVISHGLGDSAEGLLDVAQMLSKQLPHCKFILPTAPVQPVTLNGGMRMNSWYDIVGLDERSNEACHGIDESQAKLVQLLDTEHASTQLPYQRMVLAGFSQGGALSLYTGLQLPLTKKPAAICVMSGYLPHASQCQITKGLEDVPVFHGHGTQDFVVPFRMAEKSQQAVQAKGCQSYTIKSYPIGHTIAQDEMADVLRFIKTRVPDDETCRVQLKDPTEMSIKELKAAIRKAGLDRKAVGLMEKHEFVKLVQESRK